MRKSSAGEEKESKHSVAKETYYEHLLNRSFSISLKKADLSRVNWSGADLDNVDLSGASLVGADLSGATLFLGADLSGATFKDTKIDKSQLTPEQIAQAIWD